MHFILTWKRLSTLPEAHVGNDSPCGTAKAAARELLRIVPIGPRLTAVQAFVMRGDILPLRFSPSSSTSRARLTGMSAVLSTARGVGAGASRGTGGVRPPGLQ